MEHNPAPRLPLRAEPCAPHNQQQPATTSNNQQQPAMKRINQQWRRILAAIAAIGFPIISKNIVVRRVEKYLTHFVVRSPPVAGRRVDCNRSPINAADYIQLPSGPPSGQSSKLTTLLDMEYRSVFHNLPGGRCLNRQLMVSGGGRRGEGRGGEGRGERGGGSWFSFPFFFCFYWAMLHDLRWIEFLFRVHYAGGAFISIFHQMPLDGFIWLLFHGSVSITGAAIITELKFIRSHFLHQFSTEKWRFNSVWLCVSGLWWFGLRPPVSRSFHRNWSLPWPSGFRAVDQQSPSNIEAISKQLQSNSRAISEQFSEHFRSNFWAQIRSNIWANPGQFLSKSGAVWEQFWNDSRAIVEQFWSSCTTISTFQN